MTETEQNDTAPEQEDAGWIWMRVEIFGHRQHFGRGREVEQFGTKMLRLDIPNEGRPDEKGWTTLFYAGGSIFSIVPTDEATVLRRNRPWEPAHPAIESARDDDFDAEWSDDHG